MKKFTVSIKRKGTWVFLLLAIFLSVLGVSSQTALADDSICARVKIEIRQEMTLERQAFDAHIRINNGFDRITLEQVAIDVAFSDENGNSVLASSDPNNTEALFFIRIDSMENIDDINGTGVVQPAASADIHWLIIPAPGASNGLEQGKLYYVGATLTYTIDGEENVTEVTPDYIFVKPMPALTLDYFLPGDVYGDDAFTGDIEPVIPFPLGVRVKNSGSGAAKSLAIESAQPKIVENELGLLIDFKIIGSEVNGQPATESLTVDFGDITPNTSGVAHWNMTCSLSGEFVEFEADYSHSDELGGELTSLIDGTNTHFLVKDVLVDLPGRDSIRDFLAQDGDVYRVYESDSVDTETADQSAASTLNGSGDIYTLSTAPTAGFLYVQLPDPKNGRSLIKEVIRSDGKRIKADNAWLSKIRNKDHTWRHFINLFDVNTTDSYTIIFGEKTEEPHPPVFQFIKNHGSVEGERLSFIIEASDPDGTIPTLQAAPLPPGASFVDQGDGSGSFDWTPASGQAGEYEVVFTASDGELEGTLRLTIHVLTVAEDTDGDHIADSWEQEQFGNLDHDGTGDTDGDGFSDLDEFLNQTDPTAINQHTITARAYAGGDISPVDTVAVNHGANETFTITPDERFQIVGVQIDGYSQGAIETYTFTNVTEDHTIEAFFEQTTGGYVIAGHVLDPAGNGVAGVALDGFPEPVSTGSDGTYSVIVESGWSGVITPQKEHYTFEPASLTYTNVAEDHTGQNYLGAFISAYTLTAIKGGTGNGTIVSVPPGIDCGLSLIHI